MGLHLWVAMWMCWISHMILHLFDLKQMNIAHGDYFHILYTQEKKKEMKEKKNWSMKISVK